MFACVWVFPCLHLLCLLAPSPPTMRASLCVLAAAVASANAWIALGPITDGTIELFEVGNDGEAVPGLGLRVTLPSTGSHQCLPSQRA